MPTTRTGAATKTDASVPGMSDAAVAQRTGKTWEEWFAILDDAGAAALEHREIVAVLVEHEVGPLWREMVTVGYERARGRNAEKQASGGYAISVTRTVSASLEASIGAWEKPTRRKRFLSEPITFATRRNEKVLRFGWPKTQSRVSVRFVPRSKTRTEVTVEHDKMKTAREVPKMKEFWSTAMDLMQAQLEKTDD